MSADPADNRRQLTNQIYNLNNLKQPVFSQSDKRSLLACLV